MKSNVMPRVDLDALTQGRAPAGIDGAPQNSASEEGGAGLSRSEQRQLTRLLGDVNNRVGEIGSELRNRIDEQDEKFAEIRQRQFDVEQRLASRRGGGGSQSLGASSGDNSVSWGAAVTNSQEYHAFMSTGCKGKAHIPAVGNALTTVTGGALVRTDRDPNGVMLPRRRLTVRALVGVGRTGSNLVEYFREKVSVNNAAPVAEGALKPESSLEYELKNTTVRTIAHWIPASRQIMDDAPQLITLVDSSLRYGLANKEEQQLLYGDGAGENLHGMIPQATAFDEDRVTTDDTKLDVIRHAMSQAEEADLPASGIIINTRDYLDMVGIKDAGHNYIANSPLAGGFGTLWGLPVVWTNNIVQGDFLVGAFETAAQIYDRLDPEVTVSSEDRDNYIKNMLTIRAEERLAFAVKRAAALIKGSFSVLED
ncbi:phage major capsid protein [Rhizobium sp. 1399]|uniref:phage major capsid protein n=1 Tax=Rhizobium sp. 1399 TaxID=2817758 RepID=UPI002856D42B|nr:phage major capsid protein [Rhizobium sp. 1399]MDR6664282.1 HK97 family phage major capsid protein [Rhizobium sp. 1399]